MILVYYAYYMISLVCTMSKRNQVQESSTIRTKLFNLYILQNLIL